MRGKPGEGMEKRECDTIRLALTDIAAYHRRAQCTKASMGCRLTEFATLFVQSDSRRRNVMQSLGEASNQAACYRI